MRTAGKITASLLAGAALGLGGVRPAHAVPYGFASNQPSDFTLTVAGGTVSPVSGTRNTVNASAIAPGGSSATSDPVASLGSSDAAQAVSGPGPFPAENTFSQSELSSGYGARADSETAAGSPLTPPGVSFVNNVAESRSLAGFVANATAQNSASITFAVTAGTQIAFEFTDDVLLLAQTDPNAGQTVRASVQNTFQILDGAGNVVFYFAPAGLGQHKVAGGTVDSDPFDINQALDSIEGLPPVALSSNGLGDDVFRGVSDPLSAGTYTVLLNTQSAVSPTQTTEPASMLVLLAGLTGLGMLRRRAMA